LIFVIGPTDQHDPGGTGQVEAHAAEEDKEEETDLKGNISQLAAGAFK
jgi:hypothetical protein